MPYPPMEEIDLFGNIVDANPPSCPRKRKNGNEWTGDSNSVYKMLGASNHCEEDREANDYYATDPTAVEMLCGVEKFSHRIWEPCAGGGHISKVLLSHGYDVRSTDLVDRGFCEGGHDFLSTEESCLDCDIVTNPPYSMAKEFVEKALDVVAEGHKVAMFLKLTFAEGQARRSLFSSYPPLRVWVSSKRLECGKNGVFGNGSAICYAWGCGKKDSMAKLR